MSKQVAIELSPEEIAIIQDALWDKVAKNAELQLNHAIYKKFDKALSDLCIKFLDLRKKNPANMIEFVLAQDFKITTD
jgi:hypothetical protein